jgi:hypothetical protein
VDFGLSEDQQLLEETVRKFLREQVPITRVREIRDACEEDRETGCPNDRAIWGQLAELGVTGILVPEAQGGSELSLLDAALVSLPGPYLDRSLDLLGRSIYGEAFERALAAEMAGGPSRVR